SGLIPPSSLTVYAYARGGKRGFEVFVDPSHVDLDIGKIVLKKKLRVALLKVNLLSTYRLTMPAVPANTNSRVLVTGANGYVAMWLVRVLLGHRYFVRGTVRSESKGKQLKKHFGPYGDKFEWVVVNDITKESAFDEFVRDVHAIEHTASPVSPENQEDPQEYIRPAVQGTLSILTSAMKFSLTVLDEKDRGNEFVKVAEELGTKADSILKYLASKTLSERVMPTIPANLNARVLVTGANGYVAAWVVRSLLEQGYIVRGTVHSQSKGKQLKKTFTSEHYSDKFKYVIIEDFTKEGTFNEIVKDVDAIEHVTSPVTESNTDTYEDPQIYIQPAVKGTVGILESAMKYGTNVKRVVVTSSVAAILRNITVPTVLDENDWGDEWVKIVEEKGRDAPSLYKYFASKVLSEQAAWEFYENHKAKLGWELVVINPSHVRYLRFSMCSPFCLPNQTIQVLGPPLLDFKAVSKVTRSVEMWYKYMSKDQPDEILQGGYNYIDVRDLADAHVESLKKEAAGGERVIVSGGDLLFSHKPQYYADGALMRGKPGLEPVIMTILNAEKAKKILGIAYKSHKEMTLDTLANNFGSGSSYGQHPQPRYLSQALLQDPLHQGADPNSPEVFKNKILVVHQQVRDLQTFARKVLSAMYINDFMIHIRRQSWGGLLDAECSYYTDIAALKQMLAIVMKKLRKLGIRALPLVPPDLALIVSNEKALLENRMASVRALHKKLQRSQDSAAVVTNLFMADYIARYTKWAYAEGCCE
ncbi:hypothetical protein CVT25_004879, partial [Psilocybe cyanescens]